LAAPIPGVKAWCWATSTGATAQKADFYNGRMAIPQTFIQELIARADVVDIVGRYVQLKKGGANFMGLCPFHGEKSPSFSVSPTKQFYHCFGCGKNGNAIGFLMDHAGMSFVEAVHDLAQQYGMQVPEDEASPQDRARAQEQKAKQNTLTSVLEKAGEAYRRQLKDAPAAVAYLKGRGLSGEVAKQFGLGYAPQGWRSLAGVFPSYDDPLLVESGLVISNAEEGAEEKRYDRFRDRIMFPIRNIKGECIGFGGRVLGDEKPKYLNSPETPVFSKGRELYGLFEARAHLRDKGYALVTEGYMDVVALAQLGFPNAVATLGTACTNDHVQKLFRFTDAVVFSFDGDSAGRRAARKALDGALAFATDVRSIKFLFLPAEHDPDSFIRAHGADAFADYVKQATPLSRFLVESASDGCDLNTAEGRAHLSSNAKPLWMQLPEGALKLQLLAELADLVQLTSRELSDLWMPPARTGNKDGARSRRAPERGAGFEAASAASFGNFGDPDAPRGGWGQRASAPRSRIGGRARPASRADHATRILLGQSQLWETLSSEEHAMLCELPEPHGALFVWLETQLHEHGPLTWNALRADAANQAFGELALRLMSDAAATPEQGEEAALELQDVLLRLAIDRIDAEMKQIAESPASADVGPRYRAMKERRAPLAARLDALIKKMTEKV
jgi:DNA primase